MLKREFIVASVSAFLALMAAPSVAGEIEPRAYVNTPVGVNFLLAGYAYSKGDLSTPGASPLKDAQITTNSGILAYARALDVWGKSEKIDIIVPYTDLSGNALVSGQPRERQISGLNDPRARFSVSATGNSRANGSGVAPHARRPAHSIGTAAAERAGVASSTGRSRT